VSDLVVQDFLGAERLMTEQELNIYEVIIEKGLQTYIEVGKALTAIRDKRGYRFLYGTFEEYVESRWKMSISSAYDNINASKVAGRVQTSGQIGFSQEVAIGKLPAKEQQQFVDSQNLNTMSVRETDDKVREWKRRAEEAERQLTESRKETAATEAQAVSVNERARALVVENERLKAEKNPEPQVIEKNVEVAPPEYEEAIRKVQDMNTKIAQLSGEMESIRRDYESRLRDVQDGDAKSNRRELNRLLSEQLKALSWNHSSALFVYQRIAGNVDATQAVREFVSKYEDAVQKQLRDWHDAISLQTEEEATWETI